MKILKDMNYLDNSISKRILTYEKKLLVRSDQVLDIKDLWNKK